MPQVTKSLGFDFWWDTEKLWNMDLPVEKVLVDELVWMLKLPFWTHNGSQAVLKPTEVKKDPEKYGDQYTQTMQSDLSHPISIIFLNDRWVIMDGLHRLLKANILGHKAIKAKRFQKAHIPFIEQK